MPLAGTSVSGLRPVWPFAAIGLLALALRVFYQLETRDVPFLRHLVGDAAGYDAWARAIAGGEWLGTEGFYQAPLYAYALACVKVVLGDHVGVTRLVQAVWGALGTVALAVGTARLLGRRCGIVAGLMLAVYPTAIFFDGLIQKTSLGCAGVCVLLAAMAEYRHRPARWWAGCIGMVAALVILTRENALVWAPLLAIWIPGTLGSSRRERWRGHIGSYVVGMILVLGPVVVRNAVVCGDWSVSTFQAGPNFYIGNHIGASGRYTPLVRGHETPVFERPDATLIAERAEGQTLSPQEVSHYWMRRAIQDIRAEPVEWVRLIARKVLMVWNRYEVSDVESEYVYRDYSVFARPLGSVWHFGVLCPMGVMGCVATWHWRRRLWVYYALIVSMAASVALFYVMARYRFPLVPLLIPFAAAAVVAVWESLRADGLRRLVIPILAGLASAVVVNLPLYDESRLNAMAEMNVGVALAREGNVRDATVYFERAVKNHSTSAEARNNLAQALAVQGMYGEAIPHYKAALGIEPTLIGVEYNLGVALEQVGRVNEALVHFERAVDQDAQDDEARRAVVRLRRGSRE
ncbi:MAG: glycosyltransferase family 39 protein [Planctomycetes bacterium]|nr:glycosyltransferase family 39 protein [Planctomycetota bacterium]